MTSEGLRSAPSAPEIVAALKGERQDERVPQNTTGLRYPVLLISENCSFSHPAKNFWSKIADESGLDLHVITVENENGIDQHYGVSGFPCLVTGPDEHHYGIHFSHKEAKQILRFHP